MDRTYAELIRTAAGIVEREVVPGADALVRDAAGMVPDSSGLAPSRGMIPDGAVPDPAGYMPDRLGSVPQAPGVPDSARRAQEQWGRVSESEEKFRRLNGVSPEGWTHHGFGAEFARDVDAEDGFTDDAKEVEEPQRERQAFAEDEEDATAVLRVCRNGWNTIDTRAVGGHWFSA